MVTNRDRNRHQNLPIPAESPARRGRSVAGPAGYNAWAGAGASAAPVRPARRTTPPTCRQETPMSPRRPYRLLAVVLAGLLATLAFHPRPAAGQKDAARQKDPDPAAVERTRATVKLLDDVHKGYVITITDTYVKAQEKTPAAAV